MKQHKQHATTEQQEAALSEARETLDKHFSDGWALVVDTGRVTGPNGLEVIHVTFGGIDGVHAAGMLVLGADAAELTTENTD
ncbi:MAG: hypothetical protein ACFBZ8_10380 [Opitutales bacterium]